MTRHVSRSYPDTADSWLAYLSSPRCDADGRAAFARWRDADPAHARAYEDACRLHDQVASLRDDPLLRAAARSALRRTAYPRRRRGPWIVALPAAIAALLALAVGIDRWRGPVAAAPMVERRVGSPHAVTTSTLPDGSTLVLDAGASVSVRFGDRRRLVVMERGRAAFTVARAAVPFEVSVGRVVVHDVGTTFQIEETSDGVTIGLLEGVVSVSRTGSGDVRTLAPAQQLHLSSDGIGDAIRPLDVDAARGWIQGDLVFRRRRLDELVAASNRYAATTIRLGDPSLAALDVSGRFHAGDQQALVHALQVGWSLRAERDGHGDVVLYPPSRRGNRAEDHRR